MTFFYIYIYISLYVHEEKQFFRMKNGLAESLSKWLTESAYNLGMFESRRVVVVGIVGKASSDCCKGDPINHSLGLPVFVHKIPELGSTASVSIFSFSYDFVS